MALNPKLVVPLGLGLSLFTVTAFVVYYIFKKEDNDEENNKKSIKTSRVNVIELKVAKNIVPALIGRSASNIKEMEQKSGAQIHLKKLSEGDHDTCIIRGRSEATQLAETLVHEFIKNQPVIIEDVLMVPNWACGRIIGTGGEHINAMSHRSGARIKLEGDKGDTNVMRHVSLRGTKEQIEKAKELLNACIAQEKCRREIDQSKRSPRHVPSASSASPTPTNSESGDLTGDKHTHKHAANYKPEVTGAAIEVYVSAVSSPSRFWVQFVGPQVANLDVLVDTMTEYYNNKDNREAHSLKAVSVGQLVAAVFRHDGRWYRARVVDIRPNEYDPTQKVADVFFVDYGDSEYVATHELCELRADFIRLRFQAMECYLSGVQPSGEHDSSDPGHKWHPNAIERFEELTQVARWKPLVSKTCSYKKTVTAEGEKEKEIPGIKLFEVSDEGEVDVCAALVSEGWAEWSPSPRPSPPRTAAPPPPFGDLTHSMVLGMASDRDERSTSLPKDHERTANAHNGTHTTVADLTMPSSISLSSGLESTDRQKMPSELLAMSYGQTKKPILNTESDFLDAEKNYEKSSKESLISPAVDKTREDLKANMNRIDSHHGNLQSLGKDRL